MQLKLSNIKYILPIIPCHYVLTPITFNACNIPLYQCIIINLIISPLFKFYIASNFSLQYCSYRYIFLHILVHPCVEFFESRKMNCWIKGYWHISHLWSMSRYPPEKSYQSHPDQPSIGAIISLYPLHPWVLHHCFPLSMILICIPYFKFILLDSFRHNSNSLESLLSFDVQH